MGDGTFSSPREQLEWVPRGQVLIYKVAGVVHCPDIAEFSSGRSRESFCLCVFAGFYYFVLAPTKFLPSPPPSSPTANSKATSQHSASGMYFIDFFILTS
jgi:hypothetical protein